MENWIIYILNGLYFASFLFLTSLGLSIILGVMGILNLAHGSMFAVGAFTAAWIVGAFGGESPMIMFFVGLLAALGVAGVVGLVLETSIIRPMYRQALEYQLLITFGALLLIEDLIKMVWGGTAYYASKPFTVMGNMAIGDNQYPYYFLFVILMSLVTGLGIWLVMSKTQVGIMLRAISMDREMAKAMGIRIGRLNTLAFGLGGALAGLAGALIIPTTPALLGIGMDPLIMAFIVVVLGGLGSLKGALIGSLIVGETRSIGVVFFPEIELPLLFLIAVIILVFKPEGLFGK
ncbi:MAG: branched-chain amino acid ABC transporter permease [Deltaproteobacteria bacterium]|nr:branched-chain amino acid ABC transporter permease [Deltaproteobacteria bacterium]MBW1737677.1 branched-chain amino acid ABC transporter permease [Deltaproteobacteria bacterium]MBW1909373.1 branched-chain amino acid ABC transporter permease [Deltaproteobacteria bacterium]MBW2033807.1 branched-chain amino acid ABC transporter permease [Deltaproteobacteria bacterium]MBW2115199.1 branched-chain amino acid ABC transporter permease [Deltaproteobacteria bacterium]